MRNRKQRLTRTIVLLAMGMMVTFSIYKFFSQEKPDLTFSAITLDPSIQVSNSIPLESVSQQETIPKTQVQEENSQTTRPIKLENNNHALATMESSSLMNPRSMHRALIQLKRYPQEEAARQIYDFFKSAGVGDLERRERAVWYAKRLNHTAMLPFWMDLLQRSNPLFADEHEFLDKIDRLPHDERASAVRIERSQAVAGLGAIQKDSKEARDLLYAMALGTADLPHLSQSLRLDAINELRKVDRLILLKLNDQIRTNDPIAKRLQAKAKRERSKRASAHE